MPEAKPERRHDEKGKNEDEEKQEKWRRDPISGMFFGLVLILIGVVFFLSAQGWIAAGDWWKYFVLGMGVIFLIEVGARYSQPAYRRPVFGRLIAGLVLICIGAAFITGIGNWWPLILIAVGLAILIRVGLRR